MNKYIASTVLAMSFSSSAFAGSDASYIDAVRASFDRMLNHAPAGVSQRADAGADALQEVFAARLWSGSFPKPRDAVTNALRQRASAERPERTVRLMRGESREMQE